jgi:hypothetical protein
VRHHIDASGGATYLAPTGATASDGSPGQIMLHFETIVWILVAIGFVIVMLAIYSYRDRP